MKNFVLLYRKTLYSNPYGNADELQPKTTRYYGQ